jgi:virginiamycin B lyase
MRRPLQVLLLGLAVAVSGAVPASAALTPSITSYPSSDPVSAESHPYAIASGADGALWFTDPYAHRIGRITVDGTLTLQAPVPPSHFQYDITAGSDGAMWFVSQNPSSVSRIDAAGDILTKNLASATANPADIVSGPDGALWFTETVAKAIGRVPAATPLAVPDESRVTNEGANGIASGPDGNIWFVEYSASEVGRMALDGSTTYFPLPMAIDNPEAIAAGPDGALWVTTLNPAAIVRITTDGDQLTFRLPVTPFPGEIAVGADGALWFTASDNIGRITTDGGIETFPLPGGVGLIDIAAGPDGNLWFTQANAGLIGRITTPPNATTGGASDVGAKRAKVAATVNGHSQKAEVAIEYGPEDGATSTTPAEQLPASAGDQPLSVALTGLAPGIDYRYRTVATNQTGTATGAFATFTTLPAPRCRVTRARTRHTGEIKLALSCRATRTVAARATIKVARTRGDRSRAAARKRRGRTVLFGKARARVKRGKATLQIKPRKAARIQLRRRGRLSVKIVLRSHGGGTSTRSKKVVSVKQRRRR